MVVGLDAPPFLFCNFLFSTLVAIDHYYIDH